MIVVVETKFERRIPEKRPGEVYGGEGGRLGGGEEVGTTEGKGETLALEECLKSTGEGEVEEGEGQNKVWVPEITAFLLILWCFFTCGHNVIELWHRKAKQ